MSVDLRSDTVTRPTPEMREAMMNAEVGDDVFGDDPTVNRLESEAATRSGMEAALFTPSGTMANQLAIRCWTQPGDEVLMESGAHPYNYESAAHAAISGVQVRPIPAERGILDPDVVFSHVRPPDDHFAPARLLCVENTSNRGGGSVYPESILTRLCEGGRQRGLRLHLDGARIFNAVIAGQSSLSQLAGGFDSLSFCLSKGLGAPVGSLLCGPRDFIQQARRMRKMLGGGMRQAGFLAAAGLYALDHHVERLEEDHRRAHRLYEGLTAAGFSAVRPQTNMVYVTVNQANNTVSSLAEAGVLVVPVNTDTIRLVTHLDVEDAGINRAVEALASIAGSQS